MRILVVAIFIILTACKPQNKPLTAQDIINKSIVASGVDKVANAELNFTFRDKKYKAIRKNGKFELSRTFDSITDVLSNNGFQRYVNSNPIYLNDTIAKKYGNSVNSVHYFSVLPFGLNDKAVHKKLLPSTIINKKEYYKIEVTFSENGGGEDFEDIFIYWINTSTFLVDFLAYAYHTNGGGMRFRSVKNEEIVNAIRFVNYNNYKPKDKTITLNEIDNAFENNKLTKISEINLNQISVVLF